jgi:uncharacterized damage-inducible protein DinB
MQLSVEELLHYTEEERQRWEHWFRENGEEMLKMPLAGESETTVGALILHIFGPELRYVQRLRNETLSEYRGRPCEHVDEIFGFGLRTRKSMRDFVRTAKPEEWARVLEFNIAGRAYRATVRKIVLHALLHEVRHWAQMARIMRDRGFAPPGDHDLLTSSALV